MTLFEMKKAREAALNKAETLVAAAETGKRQMTEAEVTDYNAAIAEVHALNPQIERVENLNTLRAKFPKGQVIVDGAQPGAEDRAAEPWQTKEYRAAVAEFLRSRGVTRSQALQLGADEMGGFKFPARASQRAMRAAGYEGNTGFGAAIVPVTIEQQIVPLAPPEMGVEKLATVIPTTMDLKFPRKTAHGTAAFKSEGTGSGDNVFTGTDPTTEQFTLSAFMIGHPEDASWELLQDVQVFQSFMTEDILLSLAILKEAKYISGTGNGQPQGLIGNTGAGIAAAAADSNGNLLSIDSTFDVMGKLNAIYHPNATWLMSRASSIELRKAQKQANLFEPVFVRVGKQDFLHGYPCEYSTSMPAIAAGATPVLFGDFKAGYLIGIRGGAGVNVKILDQPKALEGLLTVLGYQRVDGRVRRSEAIQAITLASGS